MRAFQFTLNARKRKRKVSEKVRENDNTTLRSQRTNSVALLVNFKFDAAQELTFTISNFKEL